MWDGQRALKLIRYRAKDFGIDSNRLGVFGFSAGGRGDELEGLENYLSER
jgi:hypothetical protein